MSHTERMRALLESIDMSLAESPLDDVIERYGLQRKGKNALQDFDFNQEIADAFAAIGYDLWYNAKKNQFDLISADKKAADEKEDEIRQSRKQAGFSATGKRRTTPNLKGGYHVTGIKKEGALGEAKAPANILNANGDQLIGTLTGPDATLEKATMEHTEKMRNLLNVLNEGRYSDGEYWSPSADESNYYYTWNGSEIEKERVKNSDPAARRPWAYGYYETPEECLRKEGVIRSKYDPKKWIAKDFDGKWKQVFPFGKGGEEQLDEISDDLSEYASDLAKMKKADSFKVGDKIYTKVGGAWREGYITAPLNKAGNYGVKFQHKGQTHSYVSSPDQLRLRVDDQQLDEISDELVNRVGDARHAAVKSADRSDRDAMMGTYNKFSKNQRLQHSRDIRQQKAGLKGVDPRTAEYQTAEPGRKNFGDSVECHDEMLDETAYEFKGRQYDIQKNKERSGEWIFDTPRGEKLRQSFDVFFDGDLVGTVETHGSYANPKKSRAQVARWSYQLARGTYRQAYPGDQGREFGLPSKGDALVYMLNKYIPPAEREGNDSQAETPINELSKETLGGYVKKASRDASEWSNMRGETNPNSFANDPRTQNLRNKAKHFGDKAEKRHQGIDRATDRLMKEDALSKSHKAMINECDEFFTKGLKKC